MTIVDAHQHFWDLSAHEQPWLSSQPELAPLLRNFSLADLAPVASAAGVTATVVVQTLIDPAETPELLALAAAGELVAGVVGWADLTAPGIADDLAALMALPGSGFLSGIRHPALVEPDPGWLARPEVLRGLSALAAAGLVYDLVVRPEQLPGAVTAARAVPGLQFVLDHLGNPEVTARPDEQWSRTVRALAALPNTVCKLSGILGEPAPDRADADSGAGPGVAHIRPYYQVVLDAFGPDRMMFGSDWPPSTLGAPYGQIVATARLLTAGLSQPEQAAIFSGTARRVYALDR